MEKCDCKLVGSNLACDGAVLLCTEVRWLCVPTLVVMLVFYTDNAQLIDLNNMMVPVYMLCIIVN